MRPTYNPSKRTRRRQFGFRARMKTKGGRAVLARRRARGRRRLLPKVWSAATPATPGRDRRLPRARILRRRSDFQSIRHSGGTESGGHLKLNWRRLPGQSRRMAAIVTKACGPAVTRNRIKRWIREAWRHLQADLTPGLDSVWISRPKAATAGLETLLEEMTRLYRKAGLWGDSK